MNKIQPHISADNRTRKPSKLPYRSRLARYIREKEELSSLGYSSEAYEKKIRELAERWRV